MLNLSDLKIDPLETLGEKMLLVGVVPIYEYVDKKRTDNVTGFRYIVVCPKLAFEKVGVRIDGPQLVEMTESYFQVQFDDLEVLVYNIDRNVNITVKATGIKRVKTDD